MKPYNILKVTDPLINSVFYFPEYSNSNRSTWAHFWPWTVWLTLNHVVESYGRQPQRWRKEEIRLRVWLPLRRRSLPPPAGGGRRSGKGIRLRGNHILNLISSWLQRCGWRPYDSTTWFNFNHTVLGQKCAKVDLLLLTAVSIIFQILKQSSTVNTVLGTTMNTTSCRPIYGNWSSAQYKPLH